MKLILTIVTVGLFAAAVVAPASAEVGPWTAPRDVASAESQPRPDNAAGPDGSIATAWSQQGPSGGPAILASVRAPDGSFSKPVNLDQVEAGGWFSNLQVAYGDDGTIAVIWSAFDSNRSLRAAVKPAGGSFGAPETIAQGASGASFQDLAVTVGPDGSTSVMWQQQTTSGDPHLPTVITSPMRVSTRPPGGSFSAPTDISVPGVLIDGNFRDFSGTLSTGADGTTTAAWSAYKNNTSVVQTVTRPPGGSFGAPVDLPGSSAVADVRLLEAADGATTAIWGARASTRPPGGSFGSPETIPGDLVPVSMDAAIASDGTIVVSAPVDLPSGRIIRVVTRPPGGSFGDPTDVSTPSTNNIDSQVGIASDGTVVVSWVHSPGNTVQSSIRPPGGTFSPEVTLGKLEDETFLNLPEMAVTDAGDAVVAWEENVRYAYPPQDFARIAVKPSGGDFDDPVDLSTDSNGSLPQVSMGSGGRAAVVWKQTSVMGQIVRSAIRGAGSGTFEGTKEISSFGKVTSDPRVSMSSQGSATAVWGMDQGGKGVVQAASRTGASDFGPPQNLSDPGQDSSDAQVSAGKDGSAIAVWVGTSGSGSHIYRATRSGGGSFSSPVEFSGTGDVNSDPQIATAADGSAVAVWVSGDTSRQVHASFMPAGGSFESPTSISSPAPGVTDLQLRMSPAGDAIVAWRTTPAGDARLLASVSRNEQFDAPQTVASSAVIDAPDVAINGDGLGAVIWHMNSDSAQLTQVSSRTRSDKNFGKPVTLTRATGNHRPQVGVTPDGEIIASWQEADQKVFSSVSPDGKKFGSQTLLSDPTTFIDQLAMSTGADGETTAVWQRDSRYIQSSSTSSPFTPDPGAQCPKRKPVVRKVIRRPVTGTAIIVVKGAGPGRISLAKSKSLKGSVVKVGKTGLGRLSVKPKGRAAKRLKKRGSVKLQFRLTFKSAFACPDRTAKKRIRLVRKR